MSNKLSEAAKLLGAVGGKSGTGKSKRRSKEHYQKMVQARIAAGITDRHGKLKTRNTK